MGQPPHALRNGRFAVLWAGSTISNAGTAMQAIAVPYALFQMTGSAVWVGAAAFAGLAPSILVTPVGGAAADRFDARRVLIAIEVLISIFAILLGLTWVAGVRSPPLVLVCGSLVTVLGNASVPCWHGVMAEVVQAESIVSAVSMNSISVNFGKAVGPAIGGVVIAVSGPGWAFIGNALSNLALLLGLVMFHFSSHRDQAATGGVLANVASGARHVWAEPYLRLALKISAAFAALVLPVQHLIVPLIETEHDAGAGVVGILAGGMGLGSLVAGLLLPRFLRPDRVFVLISALIAASGVQVIVIAVVPWVPVLFVVYFLHGATFTGVMSSLVSTFHFRSEPSFRARAISLYMASFTVAAGVFTLAASLVANWLNIVVPLVACGISLVALGSWQYMTSPAPSALPLHAQPTTR